MKKKKTFKILAFSTPLFLSGIWLYLLTRPFNTASGEFFSPIDSAPIIATLIIFILGYATFLILMFYGDIKEVIFHQKV